MAHGCETTRREMAPGVWVPTPPIKFSDPTEQHGRERRCDERDLTVATGHHMHEAWPYYGPTYEGRIIRGHFFCCDCGRTTWNTSIPADTVGKAIRRAINTLRGK